jgi:hypothetical protein
MAVGTPFALKLAGRALSRSERRVVSLETVPADSPANRIRDIRQGLGFVRAMAALENLQPDQFRQLVLLLASLTDQLAQEIDRLADA